MGADTTGTGFHSLWKLVCLIEQWLLVVAGRKLLLFENGYLLVNDFEFGVVVANGWGPVFLTFYVIQFVTADGFKSSMGLITCRLGGAGSFVLRFL